MKNADCGFKDLYLHKISVMKYSSRGYEVSPCTHWWTKHRRDNIWLLWTEAEAVRVGSEMGLARPLNLSGKSSAQKDRWTFNQRQEQKGRHKLAQNKLKCKQGLNGKQKLDPNFLPTCLKKSFKKYGTGFNFVQDAFLFKPVYSQYIKIPSKNRLYLMKFWSKLNWLLL